MTTRTWNGATDAFTNGADWSPTGVPVSGDTAVISSGTVSISSAPSGVAIQMVQNAGASGSTTLNLSNVTLDASSPLTVINRQTSLSAAAPTFNISGTVTLAGTESFYGSRSQFVVGSGSTLVNAGTLNFYAASPLTTGAGVLVNSGTMSFVNPNGASQVPVFGTAITGTGQIALGENARVEFDNAVSSGQTLVFNDGANGNEIAQFNSVGSFAGTINGFSSSDLLAVVNTPYTSATYTSTGTNSGTLSLFSGTTLEGSLNFTGSYTLSSFNFNYNNFGNGQSNLQITTSVTNAVSAGLPSGYQGGAGSTTPPSVAGSTGAVYRFFDKTYGTHFFTADVGERNNIINNLASSYTEETNGFGDVSSTDPNATAVYRFFDTKYGTHFFTASASERDSTLANRPDLTYEPSSTFYEHASQQSGDVAVYRFFDTQYGTHFYTGDAGEYQGLTTPGSSTFRANLTYEGVGFYAPAGTYV